MEEKINVSLQRTRKVREILYRELFGPEKYCFPKIRPETKEITELAQPADLKNVLGKTLNEKDISILVYEPHEFRPYWMYVSSGLSDPWFEQPEGEVSGFGCELVIKTKNPGRWPIKLLRRLSYYILSYSGTLSPGVMLTMDKPIFAAQKSQLNSILVWYVDEAPDCVYDLPSGKFGLFSVLGITDDESEFVRSVDTYGCWCMQQILRQTGHQQITDPQRASVMQREDTANLIDSLQLYMENFRTQEQ